ncbi:CBS domain-containing protein [Candidatus Woesearchaeota archaeon]|nr:CBS domain-containing protein [Candidatus Woesearchaeota archaeon]MBW3022420.1 CBS domain-containing protein [Candidatus Woesearchaeota archaeon]
MKTGIQVAEAMTEVPVSVSPDTYLDECAKLMARMHVGSLIVKQGDDFLGIVTEQDFVRKAMAKNLPADLTKVKQIMKSELITISPEKDIFEALELMGEENIRHLPVVDGKRFIGFITGKDILKIQPSLFEILADKIELREEERKFLQRR